MNKYISFWKKLKNLRKFSWRNLTNEILAVFKSFSKLRKLCLSRSNFKQVSISEIDSFFLYKLKDTFLYMNLYSYIGAKENSSYALNYILDSLSFLKELVLCDIKGLESLHFLELNSMKNLEVLKLSNNNLKLRDLIPILSLKKLRYLDFYGNCFLPEKYRKIWSKESVESKSIEYFIKLLRSELSL